MSDPRINPATIKRWIDGDTVEVVVRKSIDLDFGIKLPVIEFPVVLRIRGLDTPELRGDTQADGMAAKQFAEQMAPVGINVQIVSHRVKSFERYVADVTLPDGTDFACMMRDAGHHTGKYD
jgi:endonuclease YncB( thermonuclease family)